MQDTILNNCELLFENTSSEYTLDSFTIIHNIGQGGFGCVYKV